MKLSATSDPCDICQVILYDLRYRQSNRADMGWIDTFRKVVNDPSRLWWELVWAATVANKPLSQLISRDGGIDVVNEDWDTLVILDAFRFDYFEDVCSLDGDLSPVRSKGTNSKEFVQRNIAGRIIHDTVYVTGNPFAATLDDEFHDIIPVFDFGWDAETDTVLPATLTEEAIAAHEKYPHKRIIVHYMQPHHPFLGDLGWTVSDDIVSYGDNWRPASHQSAQEFREAYRENCKIALDSVESLLPQIDGKVVVTSDHGELLGERLSPIPVRGFEHTSGLRVPELTEVPWLKIDNGERREVREDPPQTDGTSNTMATDRLKALGYL